MYTNPFVLLRLLAQFGSHGDEKSGGARREAGRRDQEDRARRDRLGQDSRQLR